MTQSVPREAREPDLCRSSFETTRNASGSAPLCRMSARSFASAIDVAVICAPLSPGMPSGLSSKSIDGADLSSRSKTIANCWFATSSGKLCSSASFRPRLTSVRVISWNFSAPFFVNCMRTTGWFVWAIEVLPRPLEIEVVTGQFRNRLLSPGVVVEQVEVRRGSVLHKRRGSRAPLDRTSRRPFRWSRKALRVERRADRSPCKSKNSSRPRRIRSGTARPASPGKMATIRPPSRSTEALSAPTLSRRSRMIAAETSSWWAVPELVGSRTMRVKDSGALSSSAPPQPTPARRSSVRASAGTAMRIAQAAAAAPAAPRRGGGGARAARL